MPYPFNRADVGDVPGKPPLSGAEKDAIAIERNAAFEETALDVKRQEFKDEALARIALAVPAWNNFERVAFLASIWNMLGAPNAAQLQARDIYIYARDSIVKLNGLSVTDMLTVNPSAALPFQVADPTDLGWPT